MCKLKKKKKTFYNYIVQWDVSNGKFRLPSPGKASCDGVALPNLGCMLGALMFPYPPNSDMDYGIFNVRTDVKYVRLRTGVY